MSAVYISITLVYRLKVVENSLSSVHYLMNTCSNANFYMYKTFVFYDTFVAK